MTITLNGTTGITTPDVTSDSYTGALAVNASAPDNSLVVDASGNVGIGTTSPNAPLTVYRTGDGTYASNLAETESKAGLIINPESNGSSVKLNFAKAVGGDGVILQSTNGSATGAYNVVVNPFGGNVLVHCLTQPSSSVTGFGATYAANGPQLYWGTSSTGSKIVLSMNNPNGQVGYILTSGSSTTYATSSDYRLKEDWQPMTGASERVKALKPVNFAWKADGSRVDGFLAHEAQAVVPEAVTGEKDAVDAEGKPVHQGIDQSKLVPLLTAALQEALAEIETLKARVSALEATNV